MSLADDLLATTQVELRKKAEQQIPKAWRASERRNDDGSSDVTSQAYEGSYEASEASLLADHGYDPETHMILGGWRQSSWTAYKPKEYRRLTEDGDADEDLEAFTFTAKAFKFKVVERPQGARSSDVEDLIRALDSRVPAAPAPERLANAAQGGVILAIGDTQIGKMENPLEGLSDRFTTVVDDAAYRLKMRGPVKHLHIAWLGDCIEGANSQGGKLRWRTTLTIVDQVRVLQRYMMYAIEALAPHAERLTVSSIPGNHDEAFSRDLATRSDDSWAIQALVSVEDAIKFSRREDMAHVECYVPGPDQQGVTIDVAGLRVAQVHGHQFRVGREYTWWQGQTFGGQDEGSADLLLHGHQHHFTVEEQGKRTRIGVPAMEAESVWYKQSTGTGGNPGSLLLTVEEGRVATIDRLS